MKGWKTWIGSVLMAGSAVAPVVGHPEIGVALVKLAAAFGLVGIGHKIEKSSKEG